jgi:hypothetical protein
LQTFLKQKRGKPLLSKETPVKEIQINKQAGGQHKKTLEDSLKLLITARQSGPEKSFVVNHISTW